MHLITAWREGLYGGEKVVLNLASSVDTSKFNVVIVAFGEEKDDIPLLRSAAAKGITVDIIPSRTRYDARGIFDVRKMINRYKVNILHCHGYKSDVLGYFAALAGKVKLVATLHGWWVGDSTKSRFHNALDMHFIRYFDRIVVVSQSLLEAIERDKALSGKTVLIPNCVNTNKFGKTRDRDIIRSGLGIPPGAVLLGTVSRLTEEKGHTYLLDALAKLRKAGKDIYLIVAGEGPLESQLKARSVELGLGKNVIFAGFRDDVSDIISALDIFLMPSLSEGLPMAVLEAMAAGKQVIATNVGGIPSIIRDRQTGIFIKPKDDSSIVEAVTGLLEDRRLFGEIAANAEKFIRENYSLDIMAGQYEKVYFEILGG